MGLERRWNAFRRGPGIVGVLLRRAWERGGGCILFYLRERRRALQSSLLFSNLLLKVLDY